MTTILDVFDLANGDSISTNTSAGPFSSTPYLFLSPNNLDDSFCKTQYDSKSMHDGLVHKYSPSFKGLTKDISLSESSDFPSVLSGKNNLRDCSDGQSIGHIMSDSIDIERSNSVNSMSPTSYVTSENLSQIINQSVQVFPQSSACNLKSIISSPCCATSNSLSPFVHNSYLKPGYPVDRFGHLNRRMDVYQPQPRYYGSCFSKWKDPCSLRQINAIDYHAQVHSSYTPMFYNHSVNDTCSKNYYLPENVPYSPQPNSHPNGVISNRFSREFLMGYSPSTPTYHMYADHSIFPHNQPKQFGQKSESGQFFLKHPNGLNRFSTPVNKFPTSSPLLTTPILHCDAIKSQTTLVDNLYRLSSSSSSSSCPSSVPSTHGNFNVFLPMSFNDEPTVHANTQLLYPGSDDKKNVSKLKHKRKGSKLSNRGSKSRRSLNEGPTSFTPNPTTNVSFELTLHSMLTQNTKNYIQNPPINLQHSLYPPSPLSDNAYISQDLTLNTCKYFRFPFALPNSKPASINEQYILKFVSQSTESDKFNQLMCTNFLIESYENALGRNTALTHFLPKSPEAASDPLVQLEQVDISHCMTPPLKSNAASHCTNVIQPSCVSYPKYREEVVCLQQLMTHNQHHVTCTNCAMPIFQSFKLMDKNALGTFCSHACMLDHQKRLVANVLLLKSEDHSIVNTFSDSSSSPIVVILKQHNAKHTKQSGKRKRSNCSSEHRNALADSSVRTKWRNVRWQKWSNRLPNVQAPKQYVQQESPALKKVCLYSRNLQALDNRTCCLCMEKGDGHSNVNNRLINLDVGKWLHLNCILWCYETYETISGSLVDVDKSMEKAMKTVCIACHKRGAGLPCFDPDCQLIYHLPCAKKAACSFYSDRSMFCALHHKSVKSLSPLTNLVVDRKVYVTRDEDMQVAHVISNEDVQTKSHLSKLRIGTLILHRLGQLLPDQLESGVFHTTNYIYPVGFWSSRIYWSFKHIGQRCRYDCRIEDQVIAEVNHKQSHPISVRFVVEAIEENGMISRFEDSTCNGVWQQILKKINNLRRNSSFIRIFEVNLHGETLFGLDEPHIIRAVESLPAVNQLNNYVFKFGKLQLIKEMPLALNPSGCARSEPKLRSYIRRKPVGESHPSHSLFDLKCIDASCSSSTNNLDLGNPQSSTLSSKHQQYRRLRYEWRTNVLLARSRIQGLGLYASRDISKHTFIIEYLGEVIRNEVANRRERLYESQNRGIYMFRVDDDWIVDATMCGGLARYINHSCDPNCSAEILHCDPGRSHIIIIACKNIEKGDELTYDYKFDLEEDRWDRIPCMCGSANCRKWMN